VKFFEIILFKFKQYFDYRLTKLDLDDTVNIPVLSSPSTGPSGPHLIRRFVMKKVPEKVINVRRVGDVYHASITTEGRELAAVKMGIDELEVPGGSEAKAVGLLVCAHGHLLGITVNRE
jgi:hypothetical protein